MLKVKKDEMVKVYGTVASVVGGKKFMTVVLLSDMTDVLCRLGVIGMLVDKSWYTSSDFLTEQHLVSKIDFYSSEGVVVAKWRP